MAELDDGTPNGCRAGEVSLSWLSYTDTTTQPGCLSAAPSSGSTGQNVGIHSQNEGFLKKILFINSLLI